MTSTTVLVCSSSEALVRSWVQAIDGSARVVQARDCERALERVFLDPGVILLLLDSNWLPFDGARLITRLRGDSMPRLADLPIFLIEQSGQSATVELWLRDGADGLLSGRRETQAIAVLSRALKTALTRPDQDSEHLPDHHRPKTLAGDVLSAAQLSAAQPNAVQPNSIRANGNSAQTGLEHGSVRHDPVQHGPVQHGPVQYNQTSLGDLTLGALAADTPRPPVAGAVLDIELNWQPAAGVIAADNTAASSEVNDWAQEFGVRLRAGDRWRSRSNCSGELQLRCSGPDVLAPLNRLARGLHNRPNLAEGKLTARFDDTTYHLPI